MALPAKIFAIFFLNLKDRDLIHYVVRPMFQLCRNQVVGFY